MARTLLTPKKVVGPYGTYSAGAATLAPAAADTTNNNAFVASGNDLILAQNSGGSAYTVTITSAPDAFGRSQDIATYSLAAGEIALFGPFPQMGWMQTVGQIYLQASNAAVKFAVIQL